MLQAGHLTTVEEVQTVNTCKPQYTGVDAVVDHQS